MNRILLLLDHRENRRILSDWLQPRYQVIEPELDEIVRGEAIAPFDLCIIGARALDSLETWIAAKRAAEQPVLLPFLLIVSRQDVKYTTRHLWQTIDELITLPIEKIELQARIETLLRSRHLSLRLQACESETTQQAAARQQADERRDEAISAQRYSDAQFRQMAETIPSVFWLFDLQTRQPTYLSPAYETIWGRPRSNLFTNFNLWRETIHPAHRQQMQDAPERCLAQGTNDEEYRIIRPDGSVRWIRDRGFVVHDEAGQPTRLAGFAEDITERKAAEAALQESEELKQRILESSLDCIKVLALSGEILYMNPGGLCLMEIEDFDQIANARWENFWQGDDQQSAKAAIAAAVEGDVGQFQGYCPTFKGTSKWWDVVLTPVRDAAGQVTQLLAVSRDITERKRDEAMRERLFTQEQTAREQAETANRIKDEFLAVLSHELRTPMNPILGWSNLLRQGKLDHSKMTQALETIERNAKLQVQLIDDLLDISRILRGKLTLNHLPLDLSSVIAAAVETVRLAADAKAIQLNVALDTSGPQVLGDAARLQQVVWNVVSNAVKFTPRAGRVDVCLEQIGNGEWDVDKRDLNDASSSYPFCAQIKVSDNGKGIHPDFLPFIFEHFRQEDSATTRKFGGLGLGLAIARQIVEMHGGTIGVDSLGEGQGATFTVRLPLLKRGQADVSHRNYCHNQSATTPHAPLAGLKVMVVDDEVDSRELVSFILEQAGASVTIAASGPEALYDFSQSSPDVLISDIGMPEMDGYTLLQRIRALPNQSANVTPAIALTAYAGEADEQRSRQVGFQKHLAKPIEPDDVIAAITELFNP